MSEQGDVMARLVYLANRDLVKAERERDEALAELARVRAVVNVWEVELGDDRCPSCMASLNFGSTCDHEEGYHHALSNLRAALEGP